VSSERREAFPDLSPALQSALERLTLARRRPARSPYAGESPSRARGRALEFADYRPYAPGDDPRLVDWRAYARLDRLYLKQFDEERARTLTLLLDASGSLDWGEGEGHKGRFARRLAAALAWVSLGRHEPVRTYLLGGGKATALPPASSRPDALAIFARLAEVREAGPTDLAESVRKALLGRRPGPTVLVGDLLDPTWPAALRCLAGSGEGAVLQVLAPGEWAPELGEEVELEDAETGERLATRLGPVELADYRRRLAAWLAEVRARCASLGLLHVALDTASPLADVLLRQLPAAGLLEGA
jgi:uncharacterized protein (DUF58 family)